MAEEVTIPILLLGDTVGKSTLLSRLSLGPSNESSVRLPVLRDEDQPFIFNIKPQRLSSRAATQSSYRLELYDTSYAEQSFVFLKPALIILCYAIPLRDTLTSVHTKWKHLVETHFNYDENLPVMLLGLQRDLRTEARETFTSISTGTAEGRGDRDASHANLDGQTRFTCVMPQEGLRVAQEMRCDRYAECSAVTGELCRQVFEDVVHMAVGSARGLERGQGSSCVVI